MELDAGTFRLGPMKLWEGTRVLCLGRTDRDLGQSTPWADLQRWDDRLLAVILRLVGRSELLV